MSRIGKKLIAIPQGVKIQVQNNCVSAEGPKGKLEVKLLQPISVATEKNDVVVKRPDDSLENRMKHGTVRSLVNNMIRGVLEGYQRKLLIEGVDVSLGNPVSGTLLSVSRLR